MTIPCLKEIENLILKFKILSLLKVEEYKLTSSITVTVNPISLKC